MATPSLASRIAFYQDLDASAPATTAKKIPTRQHRQQGSQSSLENLLASESTLNAAAAPAPSPLKPKPSSTITAAASRPANDHHSQPPASRAVQEQQPEEEDVNGSTISLSGRKLGDVMASAIIDKINEANRSGGGVGGVGMDRNSVGSRSMMAADVSVNSAPKYGSAVSNKCETCQKTVYAMEELVYDGKKFHKGCLKCNHCNTSINLKNIACLEGKYYCKPHFKQLFKLKGNYAEGFGKEDHKKNWTPQTNP
ncbi:LIM domain and actin-binding protein 1 [Irineochytrium annulatum]|nr:LIM domain and actin-binding protein 1 [Irineochytrium annulatum]